DGSLVVDMGEDLESEARVLVQHLQAARHLFAAIGLDEVAVREQLLELQANLFASLGSAIAGENGAAIRHELIEVVGHCCLLRTTRGLASLIAPASARAGHPFGRLPLPLGEGWGEALRSIEGLVTPSP